MPEVTLKPLTPKDWQQLADLRLAALQECPGNFGASYADEKDKTPESWQAWLKPEGKVIFGLFADDELIGMQGIATYREDSSAGIIWGSYIKPEYRGMGLSAHLYKACIDWGKDYLAWTKIIVSHREDNLASKNANQRFGFKYTHTAQRTFPDGVTCNEPTYELDLETLRLTPSCKCCCR